MEDARTFGLSEGYNNMPEGFSLNMNWALWGGGMVVSRAHCEETSYTAVGFWSNEVDGVGVDHVDHIGGMKTNGDTWVAGNIIQ